MSKITNVKKSNTSTTAVAAKTPWGYGESFLIAFEIMIVGFILEIFMQGRGFAFPGMPYNLIILLVFAVALVAVYVFFRKTTLVKWLSSVPCSVSGITVYAVLVLLLGFIPQEGESHWLGMLGLNHVKNSWPFLLVQIYVLVSLGLVVIRRGVPFRWKNFGFIMNHFGLWLTLLAAGMGSSDLKRVHIELTENGDFSNAAVAQDNTPYELPFSVKLLDFNIDMYDAKIGVADAVKEKIIEKHGETLPVIHKGFKSTLIDWDIEVKQYIPDAIKTDSGYISMEKPGSVAAAYVFTRNRNTGDTLSGWVNSSSLMFEPVYLKLIGSKFLFMTEPEPRKFFSKLIFRGASGKEEPIQIEVNKPHRMEGWKLYQISYDTQMGKYSTTSVLEAVRDPWLPVVYAGILMLLIGAVYMFWLGRGMRSESQE
jgi:hypothetical protein